MGFVLNLTCCASKAALEHINGFLSLSLFGKISLNKQKTEAIMKMSEM